MCQLCREVIPFSTTVGRGAAGASGCVCPKGMYMRDGVRGKTCVEPCAHGVDCTRPGASLESLPVLPGYYRRTLNSTAPRKCVGFGDACLGGTDISVQCSDGHEGPFCNACSRGYHGGGTKACEPCDGLALSSYALAVVFLLLAISALLIVLCRGRCRGLKMLGAEVGRTARDIMDSEEFNGTKDAGRVDRGGDPLPGEPDRGAGAPAGVHPLFVASSRAISGLTTRVIRNAVKIRILVSLYQVTSGLGSVYDIEFPSWYNDIVSWPGSILNLNLPRMVPISCTLPFASGYYFSLFLRTGGYLAVILLLFGTGRVMMRRHPSGRLGEELMNAGFVVVFLVYPSCSAALFKFSGCKTFNGEGEDGAAFLLVDYAVRCDDATHTAMWFYVALMLIVYPIGVPCLYAAILYRHRNTLREIRRIEMLGEAMAASAQLQERSSWAGTVEAVSHQRKASCHQDAASESTSRLPAHVSRLVAGY